MAPVRARAGPHPRHRSPARGGPERTERCVAPRPGVVHRGAGAHRHRRRRRARQLRWWPTLRGPAPRGRRPRAGPSGQGDPAVCRRWRLCGQDRRSWAGARGVRRAHGDPHRSPGAHLGARGLRRSVLDLRPRRAADPYLAPEAQGVQPSPRPPLRRAWRLHRPRGGGRGGVLPSGHHGRCAGHLSAHRLRPTTPAPRRPAAGSPRRPAQGCRQALPPANDLGLGSGWDALDRANRRPPPGPADTGRGYAPHR